MTQSERDFVERTNKWLADHLFDGAVSEAVWNATERLCQLIQSGRIEDLRRFSDEYLERRQSVG